MAGLGRGEKKRSFSGPKGVPLGPEEVPLGPKEVPMGSGRVRKGSRFLVAS